MHKNNNTQEPGEAKDKNEQMTKDKTEQMKEDKTKSIMEQDSTTKNKKGIHATR